MCGFAIISCLHLFAHRLKQESGLRHVLSDQLTNWVGPPRASKIDRAPGEFPSNVQLIFCRARNGSTCTFNMFRLSFRVILQSRTQRHWQLQTLVPCPIAAGQSSIPHFPCAFSLFNLDFYIMQNIFDPFHQSCIWMKLILIPDGI